MFSWSSQWIQHAALGWVVYEITGSGTLLGAVMGARAIPMILLAPVSGVAADRLDRRRLMQASQGLAAAVNLGVVGCPDVIAVPEAVGQPFEASGQGILDQGEVPGAVLSEGLQGLPVLRSVQGDEGLGEGVFLDVEGKAGGPLDETLLAAPGEA